RLFGRDPALGAPTVEEFLVLVHPEDRESFERDCARTANERRSTESVFRFQRIDGRTVWIANRATPVWDSRGEVSRLVGTMQDITDRREAEIRIEHLNRVYAVLSDINQTIVRVHEPHEVFSAACTIAVQKGRFRMAWIGQIDPKTNQLELVAHAGASDEVLEIVQHVMHGDPPYGSCHWVAHALRHGEVSTSNDIARDPDAGGWRDAALAAGYRSGASLPLKVRGRVFGVMNLYAGETDFFDADEIRLLDELAVDISFAVEVHQRECDRKRAEAALHESEERFRQMTEAIREVFWLADPISNHLLYISPAYESVWGRSRAELYADPQAWMDALHPDDRHALAADRATITEEFDYDREYRIIRGDGELRWIHARAFPVRNAGGEVYRVAGVAEDVTERKELEAQFRQSQKLEAIGQLSGGIAHDFNNVLTVILGSVYLVRTGDKLPPAVSEALDEIVQAGTRAANLTRQLLMFSRRQVLEPRVLDLNAVVAGLGKMLRRILREDVVLDVVTPPEPVPIRADQGMMEQVLLNLAVNSRDAMPRGGRLELATKAVTIDPGAGTRPAQMRLGRFACLTVVDTGVGIPPEILPRIFEPYFTTKYVGKGTGLGLATVFGIVDQHGGWINVQSEVGRGTRFDLYFPLEANSVEATTPAPSASHDPSAAQGTILLVEDEDAVRRVARLTLVRAGYRVLEAANAREAMEIWRQQRDQIDILLTDLVMPEGISGRELAEQLVPEKPRLGVIYMSGYSPEIAGRGLVLNEGVNFLPKPYEPERLTEVVREMWRWTRRPSSGNSRSPLGPTG
ncbi:MAG TPA: PAS domain-containing protein, partial [Candidatus Synoicihabitans sp.]|nr:PAS domain-containing protein [Candidatus Synoicihabitans sp.]